MRLNKVIVVFLFILLLSFLYSIIQISNMNNWLIKLKQIITETTNQKDLLKNSMFQSIFFSNFEISDFFYTDNDERIFFKNIVGDGVLVFRIFENSCSSCVDREFGNISKLEKEGLPILIVASYENRRLLNLYLKEYDIKSKVYNLKSKFCIDDSRVDFYNQHKGIFCDSTKDFRKVIDSLLFQYDSIKHCGIAGLTIPICDIATYKQIKRGLCEHQTVFNSRLMTALGMPVVTDFVPTWGNRSKGHSWNVLILNKKIYPFEPFGDDERWKYSEIYNNETFDLKAGKFRLPKVFRQTFEYHLEGPMLDEKENKTNIPILFLNPWMLDVSTQYFKTSDVTIRTPDDIPCGVRYCYLCVFEAVSATWSPVQWGKIEKGKVVFKDMGRDIVYLPAFCINGNMVPAGSVFILDKDGKCVTLKHNSEKQNITVNTLSSLSTRYKDKLIGACVIGCKNINNLFQQDTLSVINDTIESCYNKIELHSKNKYRYICLTFPQDTIALNEISFYESSSEKQIQIKDVEILTKVKCKSHSDIHKMADNLTGTGFLGVFNDKNEKGKSVLFDLGGFYEIGSFSFVPFAESCVNIDDYFILYYWDNNWTAIKKIKGGSEEITFTQVPSSALYLIKSSRPSAENYYAERIFTYEDGKIIWW